MVKKYYYVNFFLDSSLVEELEPGDLGDATIDEEMVIVVSEDLSGGVDPIEFHEVSRTDDPDPVKSPPPKTKSKPFSCSGVLSYSI